MDFDRILCERRRSCCVGSSGLKGESMVTDITRYLQTWSAVGKEAPNLYGDVARIQVLLSLAGRSGPTLLVDGKVSPNLIGAITAFQRDVMKIEPTTTNSTSVGAVLSMMNRTMVSMPLVPRSMTRDRPPVRRAR